MRGASNRPSLPSPWQANTNAMGDAAATAEISVSDIWATSGVLLGLQVAATSYRISAETARRTELQLAHEPLWLSPCEILNLGGMVVCVLLVFVLPMTLHSDGLVQVGFSVYALLYAAYPFALLGHHSMFSSFLSAEEPSPRPLSDRTVCTVQERNVILCTTVAVCAQLLGSLASPGGAAVDFVAIVLCPIFLCFYVLVHRAADDEEDGSDRRGRRRAASARKKPYRQLLGGAVDSVEEDDEDFRYEVRIEFASGEHEDIGLELRDGRDGIEVSDVRPDSLAARAPHVCPGMVLVRIVSKVRTERSALDLSVADVLKILDSERPVSLIFEHPWQRETDKHNEVYYYNSFNDEAVWDRPAELGAVVKAMRRWYGTSGATEVRRGQTRRGDDRRGRRMRTRSLSPRSERSASRSPVRTVGSRRVMHRDAPSARPTVRTHTPRRNVSRLSPA